MLGSASLTLSLSALFATRAAGQPAQTVLAGVYTETQAERGEMQFHANCARCHVGADVDGPPLEGDPFIDRWREDSLASLFNFIKTKMPQDSPGTLSDSVYRDILSYLLKSNDYPSGKRELSAELIEGALLVGKAGPKPLPANTLVRVVGCLSAGVANAWSLIKATDPVRTRDVEKTASEDLRSSAQEPQGSLAFHLQKLDELKPSSKPEIYSGQRVQVKGVLLQSGGDRINVLSLESTGLKCAP